MICLDCQAASRDEHAAVSKELHSKCKGGTWCDCQHVLGSVINREVVRSGTDARVSRT